MNKRYFPVVIRARATNVAQITHLGGVSVSKTEIPPPLFIPDFSHASSLKTYCYRHSKIPYLIGDGDSGDSIPLPKCTSGWGDAGNTNLMKNKNKVDKKGNR